MQSSCKLPQLIVILLCYYLRMTCVKVCLHSSINEGKFCTVKRINEQIPTHVDIERLKTLGCNLSSSGTQLAVSIVNRINQNLKLDHHLFTIILVSMKNVVLYICMGHIIEMTILHDLCHPTEFKLTYFYFL